MKMTRLALAAVALALTAGCGLKGGLERPPPMFGHHDAQQRANDHADAQGQNAQPPAPPDDSHGIGAPNTSGAEVRPPSF